MGTSQGTVPRLHEYRLFDAGSVGLAAFFFGPLAGAILIAINYFRLGKPGRGIFAAVLGFTATALLIAVKWILVKPWGSLASLVLVVVFFFCTWQIAEEEQGDTVENHVACGGQLATKGEAVLVGIVTLAILFGVICAADYGIQNHKMLLVGSRDQVVYSGIMATKADATALGDALKDDKYFEDRGATVFLDKGIGGTTISFAVQDGIWNQAGMLSSFEELGRELAPTVGGFPVQVRLVDSNGDVEETSTVGEVTFGGRDGVYYEGSATKAQARALGRKLKSMGFFRGKGANVLLSRHDDGTILVFVVAVDGAWNRPNVVSSFETIVRDVAPTVGGLPIELHLVNSNLDLEKDEAIK